jgi:undecaprenyl diphosphate synthase
MKTMKTPFKRMLEAVPADIQQEIIKAKEDTAHFTGTTCAIGINYGGRNELVRAVNKLVQNNQEITEESVKGALDMSPDVDLLIRTGGEKRLSNFLLWQTAYAEFVFTDTLWPDYNEEEFYKDIEEFQKRSRRFGGVLNQ